MGYRSDVVALIYPDAETKDEDQARYDQLKVLMATLFKATIEGADERSGFTGNMHWFDDERVLKFDIPDVKWYDSYADVQAFHAMLGQFEADEIPGYCTEFVRIGEDNDDVHESRTGSNNQYYLNVRRSIDCNV